MKMTAQDKVELFGGLAKLLEAYGTRNVLEALGAAAGSCGDVAGEGSDDGAWSQLSQRLNTGADVAANIEQNFLTLAMGCEVLADIEVAAARKPKTRLMTSADNASVKARNAARVAK